MERNFDFSMQDAMRLAETPAGQQLLTLLQQQNSSQLQQAMTSVASGDYKTAQELLGSMLHSPEIRKLLQQLGG